MKYDVGDPVSLWYWGIPYEGEVVKTRKNYNRTEVRVRFTSIGGKVKECWRRPREIMKLGVS